MFSPCVVSESVISTMEENHKIVIPNVIMQTFSLFHFIGLWTKEDVITIRQYFRFAYFTLFIVSCAVEAYFSDSKDESVFLTVASLVATVQLFRMYCMMWKQDEIAEITQEIGVYSVDDSEVFSSATRKLKRLTTLLRIFNTYLVINCAVAVIIPLVTRREIFNVAFPLNYEKNEAAFFIAWALISLSVLISIICCMFAPIVWYLMMNLIIKYDMLGSRFKNLFVVKSEGKNPKRKITPVEQNELFLKRFVEAIKVHEETFETVKDFASTFSTVFLLQVVTSSICICGTIYTLTFNDHDNLFQDLFYTAVLFYSFVDIFMLMYLGNEIKLSSSRLSLRLYESDWIGQTETCKRLLLIVVERLKIPQELIVGKLFPLNLQSFELIVHRAYSMFNILLNLRN